MMQKAVFGFLAILFLLSLSETVAAPVRLPDADPYSKNVTYTTSPGRAARHVRR